MDLNYRAIKNDIPSLVAGGVAAAVAVVTIGTKRAGLGLLIAAAGGAFVLWRAYEWSRVTGNAITDRAGNIWTGRSGR